MLELQRGRERVLPLADRRLEAGDRLLLRVTRAICCVFSRNTPFSWLMPPASGQPHGAERWRQTPAQQRGERSENRGSAAAGRLHPRGASLRELRFRQRHNATVLALRRGQQTVQERLGQAVLREGDVLLLQAPFDAIRGLQASNDLLVLDQLENDLPTVQRKPLAVTVPC